MNMPLFLILFGLLSGISLWMGRRAGKENISTEDYFLAGRSLKLFPLMMTLLATQLGGGAMMGAAEEAYAKGWSVLCYPLGMVAGLVLLGLGIGARLRTMELKTIAELFERHYKSTTLRRVAALFSIISLFFILTAQAIAVRKFFGSLGIAPNLLFSLFWLTVVLYTTFGGLKGVVVTDVVQALFILGALTVIAGIFFFQPALAAPVATEVAEPTSSLPWFSWMVAPLLFMLIEQDMGQRCFSAKDSRTISRAALGAGALLFIATLVPIFFGCMAAQMGLKFDSNTSVLLGSVSALTNPTATSLIALAILMAIISTVDSLFNSICSNLVFDFPLFQKKGLKFAQIVTALLGASTFALSFFFNNVLSMLIFSYELSISVLSVPVAAALLLKRKNQKACMAAMIGGGLGFLLLRGVPFFELIVLALSATLFFAVELLSPAFSPKSEESLNK